MLQPAVPVDTARSELDRVGNRDAYCGGRAPRPGHPPSGPGGGASACHKSEGPAEAAVRGEWKVGDK